MKKLIYFSMIFSLIFMAGCRFDWKYLRVGEKPSVCDEAPENSLICKHISDPETADLLLRLSTGAIIRLDVFAIEDVEKFCPAQNL